MVRPTFWSFLCIDGDFHHGLYFPAHAHSVRSHTRCPCTRKACGGFFVQHALTAGLSQVAEGAQQEEAGSSGTLANGIELETASYVTAVHRARRAIPGLESDVEERSKEVERLDHEAAVLEQQVARMDELLLEMFG